MYFLKFINAAVYEIVPSANSDIERWHFPPYIYFSVLPSLHSSITDDFKDTGGNFNLHSPSHLSYCVFLTYKNIDFFG